MLTTIRTGRFAAAATLMLGLLISSPASVLAADCDGFADGGSEFWVGQCSDGGTPPNPPATPTPPESGSGGPPDPPPACTWSKEPSQPSDPFAGIWLLAIPTPSLPVDPDTYILLRLTCPQGVASYAIQSRDTPLPPPQPPAPPDPRQLARQVVARLPIPAPAISIGPDPTRVAVKIPMHLWIDNPGTLTTSGTDRGLTITAATHIEAVTWSMGEPDLAPGATPVDHPARRAPTACHVDSYEPSITFTCPGPGSPNPADDSSYAYTYHWRSLPERTAGTGTWTITATATWTVTWTASTGETGTDTITRTATLPVLVREWRVVLVDGG